jgi:hypothetical protein
MSSQQSFEFLVQQASDLWVTNTVQRRKPPYAHGTVWLSTLSSLRPSVSQRIYLYGALLSHHFKQHCSPMIHPTLSSEVKHIWRKRLRLGTVLYILARYPAFFTLFPFSPYSLFDTILNYQGEMLQLIKCINFTMSSKVFVSHVTGSDLKNRTCDNWFDFLAAIDILPLIGIQGNDISNSAIMCDLPFQGF